MSYEGAFCKGRFHGVAILTNAEGKRGKVLYENDKMIKVIPDEKQEA